MSLEQLIDSLSHQKWMSFSDKQASLGLFLQEQYQVFKRASVEGISYLDWMIGTRKKALSFLAHENVEVSGLYIELLRQAVFLGYFDSRHIEFIFRVQDERGLNLFECLSGPNIPGHAFYYTLHFLNEAHMNRWISASLYFELLFCDKHPNFSFCVNLLGGDSLSDVYGLNLYLSTLDYLYHTGQLSSEQGMHLLSKKTLHGVSVMHHMANTFHVDIGMAFFEWFQRNTFKFSLAEQESLLLLTGCGVEKESTSVIHAKVHDMQNVLAYRIEEQKEKVMVNAMLNMDGACLAKLICTKGFFATPEDVEQVEHLTFQKPHADINLSRLPQYTQGGF
ncbi:MAG: hypothetical protein P1U61_04935 [Legionellaceae bacterium]|nr:hypothetical protein [Legionellaceae bacterium]